MSGRVGAWAVFVAVALAMSACSGGSAGDADASDAAPPGDASDVTAARDTAPDVPSDLLGDVPSDAAGVGTPDVAPDIASPPRVAPYECLIAPDCDQVMVSSHRGYHLEWPENSLAGLRAAAELGVDFVEVDVRDTSDEVLVLMHDSDVDRTTDGTGAVGDLTWDEIRALRLKGGIEGDAASERVPRFADALALARELGIMLYVDQKTGRTDLVLAAVQDGDFHDVALVRDGADVVAAEVAQDPALQVLPAIESWDAYTHARDAIPNLRIVELSLVAPDPSLTGRIRAEGVKVQQDVMAAGDLRATLGDYGGWKAFIEAGVSLPQTDLPQLLVPALREFERTGVFPDEGPEPSL